MTVLPKQIADHPGKNLPVRERPIRSCQSRVVAGDVRAGNNEKERCDCHQQREAMNTLRHSRFGLWLGPGFGFWPLALEKHRL